MNTRRSGPLSRGTLSLLACALTAAMPGRAQAFVRTVGPPAPSSSSTCEGGAIYTYWVARNLTWTFFEDPQNPLIEGDVAWSDALAAVTLGAQAWQGVSCTDLTFQYQGTTSNFTVGYDRTSCQNTNSVIFRANSCSDTTIVPAGSSCLADGTCGLTYNCWDYAAGIDGTIALTGLTYDAVTGEILDSDMEFDATSTGTGEFLHRFTVGTGPTCTSATSTTESGCVATDIQNVATHEFGHFIGLGHTTVADSTMNASTVPGELSKRTLGADDQAGVCNIYPKGAQANWCIPPNPTSEPLTCQPASKSGGCSSGGDEAGALALLVLGWVGAVRRRRGQPTI